MRHYKKVDKIYNHGVRSCFLPFLVYAKNMARPLRIEFHGALYHVTSRGDGQDDIYHNDNDRKLFLKVLEEVCEQFNWILHA